MLIWVRRLREMSLTIEEGARNREANSMGDDALVLLRAVGVCHGLLKEHASQLREDASNTSVTHWFDLYNLDGACGLEEYVDAELQGGQAISWRLEVTVTPDKIIVEADVRKIHELGQDVIAQIAERTYSTVVEYANEITEIVRRLIHMNPTQE